MANYYYDSDEAARRPSQAGGENPLSVAGMLLAGLVLTAGAVWLIVQEANQAKPRDFAGEAQAAPASLLEHGKSSAPADTKQSPKKPPTFEEAYAEAEKLATRADAEEPAATRRALARLDEHKRQEFRATADTVLARPADELAGRAAGLSQDGLSAWVSMASRKVARSESAFKATARAMWDPTTGAGGILSLMNVWGTFDSKTRSEVVAAARSGARARPGADARRTIAAMAGSTPPAR